MHYLGPADVDRRQWDALIAEAPNGLIYALSWYLDVVSPGWAALVKQEQGRYVAGLPLPVQTKFGFQHLKQPVFAQQLGLFYLATAAPTPADWRQIGQLLRRRFRVITKYSFNTANAELLGADLLGLAGHVSQINTHTFYLSLRPDYPQLLAGYRPNRRRQLNQARRGALLVGPSTDIELLVRLFAENTAGKIYGVLGEAYEYPMLRSLYATASQAGLASMWQARTPDGEVLAMLLLWRFKGQYTYLFNGSTAAGRQARAVSVLLDEVFRTHAGQDLCFDFEAPDVANLEQFYRSFGPVEKPFLTVSLNRLPWPLRQLQAARAALYRRLRPRQTG